MLLSIVGRRDESRFNIRIGVFQHQNESMCFSTLKLEIIHNFLLRTREDVMHREIIDNFLLRTEEDVIHNIHPSLKSDT